MYLGPVILRRRVDPFDDPAWTFELKLDGFRCMADTIEGRLLARGGA
jgi:ATP-dependent DNA ligase